MVVFNSESAEKGKVNFMFCVTNVTHDLNYEQGDNVVGCASK